MSGSVVHAVVCVCGCVCVGACGACVVWLCCGVVIVGAAMLRNGMELHIFSDTPAAKAEICS